MSIDPDQAELTKDQRQFNERLIRKLEELGIAYAIGGSVAAMSYSKFARFTKDVDMMLDADATTILEFNLPALLPINVMDGLLGTKADLYVARTDGLDASAMSRRRKRKLYLDPDFDAWFLAPENVILYKLDYFRQSEGTAQKHPTDIHNMLRAIAPELEFAYLEDWAGQTGVLNIWLALWDEFNR